MKKKQTILLFEEKKVRTMWDDKQERRRLLWNLHLS